MLADAIRAENFRLLKNRTTLLWSTVFVPVMGLIFGAVGIFVMKASEAKITSDTKMPPQVLELMSSTPINVVESIAENAGKLDNPALLLFVLIGAATIYAGDYRWETWRLISARNSRANLLLGKLAVTAMLALAAMGLMLVGGLFETLIRASVFTRPLTFGLTGELFGQLLAGFGLSWLRIVQFTMMGMLAAVVTRSLLVALFVPLVVGVAQFFTPQILAPMGVMPDAWLSVLLNPGAAMDALKLAVIQPEGAPPLPDGMLLKSVLSMTLWTLVPLAGALAWFNRQDLSKE
ncbi:ABC transporter permease subunit [Brevundimonas sp.]|uniref:ABC transporter permease subunit n=1 Tax=Brevundimonas sp. TaxID=1871086 RepID=UPI0025BE2DC0|nr:ABC transporter permease subunit [Brevundimonas sp.]